MTSSDRSRSDEVSKGESLEGSLRAARRLDSVVDVFCHQVSPSLIIASNPSILLVVDRMELLEAFCVGVVDVLSIGHKRSRRSVGIRHFVWRTG